MRFLILTLLVAACAPAARPCINSRDCAAHELCVVEAGADGDAGGRAGAEAGVVEAGAGRGRCAAVLPAPPPTSRGVALDDHVLARGGALALRGSLSFTTRRSP